MADLMIEKFETKKVLFFMFAKTVVCQLFSKLKKKRLQK